MARRTIEWWGYQKEMNKIYPHSSIVVLPSYYGEGIPKTLIEAAACGRAVITTDHLVAEMQLFLKKQQS